MLELMALGMFLIFVVSVVGCVLDIIAEDDWND